MNGVREGINRWNTATDASGNRTNYCFQLDQNIANPDITIAKGTPPGGGCAGFSLGGWNPTTGGPYTIFMPDTTKTLDLDTIAGRSAHELGHTIGLANCNASPSIMNGSNPGCATRLNNQVKPADVAMSNQQADPTRRPMCPTDAKSGTDPTAIGGIGPQRPEATPTGTADYCAGQQGDFGCWCPVIVDVDGDGFNLTDYLHGVAFDLNSDGVRGWLSWTAPGDDDAWLVLDRNGNDLIDDGTELFGNFTPQPFTAFPNGFLALAEFDRPERRGNNDGGIDGADTVYPRLRLWQDINHNGISEAAELHSLTEFGLESVDLNYKASKRTDEHGNRFRYRTKLRRADGSDIRRWAWDVFLIAEP